jgi:hypothetical protein
MGLEESADDDEHDMLEIKHWVALGPKAPPLLKYATAADQQGWRARYAWHPLKCIPRRRIVFNYTF